MANVDLQPLIDFTLFSEIGEGGIVTSTNSSGGPSVGDGCTGVCTRNFSQVNILTPDRENEIYFPSYARIDGSSAGARVDLSGPYKHNWDTQARVFVVDVPRFTTSMEYDMYVRVKQLDEPSRASQNPNPLTLPGLTILLIVGGIGLCVICCCSFFIIYKVRKFCGVETHQHSKA